MFYHNPRSHMTPTAMVTRVQDQVYDLQNTTESLSALSAALTLLTSDESTPVSVSSEASSVLTIFSGTTTARHENYSSFCGLCRDIRRELVSANVVSDVDIGHWDDLGRTSDAHKRKWAGKLRSIINSRSARLRDCTVMMNALAGQSFVNMADMLQALKEHEVGSAQSPLHIVGAEEGTEDMTKIDWEGIRFAIDVESSGDKESFGSIPIGLDLSAETGIGGLHVVITPEPGEPLSAVEQSKLEKMEQESNMVFFGAFDAEEEWALVPVILDSDGIATSEDGMTTDGAMGAGDTVAGEASGVVEGADQS
ncbi:hypothetical protein DFP73DRAFT_524702 [Morchella snyderi]|nr:hypothetical protein DFP73DRAFT_524702 [Morchella snyderi]